MDKLGAGMVAALIGGGLVMATVSLVVNHDSSRRLDSLEGKLAMLSQSNGPPSGLRAPRSPSSPARIDLALRELVGGYERLAKRVDELEQLSASIQEAALPQPEGVTYGDRFPRYGDLEEWERSHARRGEVFLRTRDGAFARLRFRAGGEKRELADHEIPIARRVLELRVQAAEFEALWTQSRIDRGGVVARATAAEANRDALKVSPESSFVVQVDGGYAALDRRELQSEPFMIRTRREVDDLVQSLGARSTSVSIHYPDPETR